VDVRDPKTKCRDVFAFMEIICEVFLDIVPSNSAIMTLLRKWKAQTLKRYLYSIVNEHQNHFETYVKSYVPRELNRKAHVLYTLLPNVTSSSSGEDKTIISDNFFEEDYICLDFFENSLGRLYYILGFMRELFDNDILESFKITKPKLHKSGGKKTVCSNFATIASQLRRTPEDLADYFSTELCAQCSIGKDNALIIKGRGKYFSQGLMNVLESYVDNFVICKQCSSFDTQLHKRYRKTFLKCNNCLSDYMCL